MLLNPVNPLFETFQKDYSHAFLMKINVNQNQGKLQVEQQNESAVKRTKKHAKRN